MPSIFNVFLTTNISDNFLILSCLLIRTSIVPRIGLIKIIETLNYQYKNEKFDLDHKKRGFNTEIYYIFQLVCFLSTILIQI